MELNIGRLVFMMRMGNQWTSKRCAAVSVENMEKVQWAVRPAALKDVLANNDGLQISLGRITWKKMLQAVHAFKPNKACGRDMQLHGS